MATADKTFYLETFGCQMNVHDSEKVVGTLVSQGQQPTADFAVNSDQAEGIAADKADAAKRQADSVANINGAFGVKEAGIHAGAEVKAAGIGADAARFGHQLAYNAATRDTDVRSGDERYKVDHGTEHGITPTLAGGIDQEIDAQLGLHKDEGQHLGPNLRTNVRQRAGQIYIKTHDVTGSVQRALAELTVPVQSGGQTNFEPRPAAPAPHARPPLSAFQH